MSSNTFSSRIGFILVSAGCAIGLGNVWRFPYIAGKYGGAAFVLTYLLFLAILGLPIVLAEFAVGRASVRSVATSFDALEPPGTKWHWYKYGAIAGNFLLMMFYTPVSGWMTYYLYKEAVGGFEGLDPAGIGGVFGGLLSSPGVMAGNMILMVLLGFGVCYLGVRAGVERITKLVMSLLLVLMVVLAVKSATLPGGEEGIRYYLWPDFARFAEHGLGEPIAAAMGQAFFTLSIGIGALAIFGSYITKKKKLTGEAVWVILLDTFVALMAGFIIFPACSSYGVSPDSGPNLLFITLPNIFNNMPGGRLWGTLFFLFMFFAALSTVIAVFENIIACLMELMRRDRKTVIRVLCPAMILLAMPCVLGFNLWGAFQPLGPGSCVLDLEDFLVSDNLLPIGGFLYITFCTSRYGWGWNNFLAEVNAGQGIPFPTALRFYVSYILPLIILAIFANGYYARFFHG